MSRPRCALVLGFACLVVVTLCCSIPWGPFATSFHGQVLVPVGTVLRVPGFTGVAFNVPSEGGVLVGAADVDHAVGIVVRPAGGPGIYCPAPPSDYFGSPRTYTADQNLAAGNYTWGPGCGSWGNITVTQSIEMRYN